jgi:hypothetical protein
LTDEWWEIQRAKNLKSLVIADGHKQKVDASIRRIEQGFAHATTRELKRLQEPATNSDYAGAFELWISPYERLDQLQTTAQKRFNATRDDVERYREGRARGQQHNDIVDGEFEEVAENGSQKGQVLPAGLEIDHRDSGNLTLKAESKSEAA